MDTEKVNPDNVNPHFKNPEKFGLKADPKFNLNVNGISAKSDIPQCPSCGYTDNCKCKNRRHLFENL